MSAPRPLDPARAVLALIEERDALAAQVTQLVRDMDAMTAQMAWLEDIAQVQLVPEHIRPLH